MRTDARSKVSRGPKLPVTSGIWSSISGASAGLRGGQKGLQIRDLQNGVYNISGFSSLVPEPSPEALPMRAIIDQRSMKIDQIDQ